MDLLKVFCFSLLIGFIIIKGALGYVRVCYYTNWSQFNPAPYTFTPSRVPSQLCTHIVFAFVDINGTNITTTEFNDIQVYRRLNRLRRDNPSLQLLLAIGGWAAGGSKFSKLVSNQSAMVQFADNLVVYLRRYSFDGANIDWQYPTEQDRGSDVIDRSRFTRLLEITRTAFEVESQIRNRTRLSLSVAVEANITESRTFYETKKIGRVLDWAFLMAYDFYGYWDLTTGALHHSALYPDISNFVNGWLKDGFPADKIVLGVASFGRSFTLTSEPVGDGRGQAVSTGGAPGNISRTEALLEYGEICANVASKRWRRIWLSDQSVPVAYGNTTNGWQWVGYDDTRSLREKAAFIRQKGLAGVMFWSLDRDDFTNVCGQGVWPLMRTLARELPVRSSSITETTIAAKTTTKRTTTSASTPKMPTLQSKSNINKTKNNFFASKPQGPKIPKSNITSTTVSSPRYPLSKVIDDKDVDQLDYLSPNHVTATAILYNDNDKQIPPANIPLYKQCKMSNNVGPTLICPPSRGKQGDKQSFYLFCASGFLAIECRCLPGHFFNRCRSVCDKDANFMTCPIVH